MKFLALFFAFFMIFSTGVKPVYADPDDPPSTEDTDDPDKDKDKEEEEEKDKEEDKGDQKESDVSYYKIASAASTFYEEIHNPKYKGKDDEKGSIDGATMNNASSLMGFKDEDYDSWIIGSTVSKLSASAQGRGYNAPEDSVRGYLLYGNALAQLGLDKTDNANFNAISSIGRYVFGGFFLIVYMVANAADLIMEGCLKVLTMINPFSLFMGPGGITSGVGEINGYGDGSVMLGLSGLQKTLSKFYKNCQDFAWIIIPFMLLYVVWGFLMRPGAKTETGGDKNKQNLRKYITRVFFIVLGVPVLASSLALGYKAFEDIKDGEGFNPNGVVAMTFMDFETWARQTRLGLPDNMTIKVDTMQTPSGSIYNLSNDPTVIASRLNSHISSGFTSNASFFGDKNSSSETWGQSRKIEASNAIDLLNRYRLGAFYDSTSYESDIKNLSGKDDYRTLDEKTIEELGNRKNWHKGKISLDGSGEKKTIVNDGDTAYLQCLHSDGGYIWTFSGGAPTFNERSKLGESGGLSTLGMYNYLNTTFTPASVIVYSSNKLSSIVVRDSHRAVSLVGEGIMSVLNYLNGLSLLFFIATIAIGYGIAMLMGNLKRTIRLISAVPFGVLGSLRMMARLTTIVGMMIIEVLGTLLAYIVVLEMIYGINQTIANTFMALFSKLKLPGAIGLAPVNGFMVPLMLGVLICIIFNVWFLIMALRVRKSMIKAVDEWMAGLVDKFFLTPAAGSSTMASDKGVNSGNQKQPGVIGRAAGGLASGAGVAAGMRAANGMFDKITNADDGVSGVTGGAENATGDEEMTTADAGTAIEGADRQAHGSEGVDGSPEALTDSRRGQLMLASGATTLDDVLNEGSRIDNNDDDMAMVSNPDADTSQVDRDINQAKSDAYLQKMTGETGGLEEEKDKERAKEIKKDAKAERNQAGAKATVGAAEAVVGSKTGNADMTADGARRVKEGAAAGAKANKNVRNASGKAAQERVAQNNAKKTVEGQKAIDKQKQANKSFSNQMSQQKSLAKSDSERKKSVRNAAAGEVKDVGVKAVTAGAVAGGLASGAKSGVSSTSTTAKAGASTTKNVNASKVAGSTSHTTAKTGGQTKAGTNTKNVSAGASPNASKATGAKATGGTTKSTTTSTGGKSTNTTATKNVTAAKSAGSKNTTTNTTTNKTVSSSKGAGSTKSSSTNASKANNKSGQTSTGSSNRNNTSATPTKNVAVGASVGANKQAGTRSTSSGTGINNVGANKQATGTKNVAAGSTQKANNQTTGTKNVAAGTTQKANAQATRGVSAGQKVQAGGSGNTIAGGQAQQTAKQSGPKVVAAGVATPNTKGQSATTKGQGTKQVAGAKSTTTVTPDNKTTKPSDTKTVASGGSSIERKSGQTETSRKQTSSVNRNVSQGKDVQRTAQSDRRQTSIGGGGNFEGGRDRTRPTQRNEGVQRTSNQTRNAQRGQNVQREQTQRNTSYQQTPNNQRNAQRQQQAGGGMIDNRPINQRQDNIATGNTAMNNTNVLNQAGSRFVSRGASAGEKAQRDFQANMRESQRQMAGQIAKMRREGRSANINQRHETINNQVTQENKIFEKSERDKKDFQREENHEDGENI